MRGFQRKVDNKLKGALGETDFNKRIIRINKKKSKRAGRGEVLKTIVHEEMHMNHPKMKEKNVEATMQRNVKKLPAALRQAYYNRYPNK